MTEVGWKIGLPPGLCTRHHNSALSACPNGDVIAFYYNSFTEDAPNQSIVVVRLFGYFGVVLVSAAATRSNGLPPQTTGQTGVKFSFPSSKVESDTTPLNPSTAHSATRRVQSTSVLTVGPTELQDCGQVVTTVRLGSTRVGALGEGIPRSYFARMGAS